MMITQHSCHITGQQIRLLAFIHLLAVLLLPLQRQATDSKQWFSHLQHEIDILSTVSRNRNVVQASLSPGRFHVITSALPACHARKACHSSFKQAVLQG